jgi:hypothetical protein
MNDGTKPDGARAGGGARTGGARGGASVTAGATVGATATDDDGTAPALGMKDDGTNVDGAAVASAADGVNDDGRNLVDTGAGATTGADAITVAAAPIGVGAIAGANDDGATDDDDAKVEAVVAAAAARSKNVESLESPNALANGSSVEPERPFVDSASEYSVCIDDDKGVSETGAAKVAVGWNGLTDADTATALLVGGESDARGTNAVG